MRSASDEPRNPVRRTAFGPPGFEALFVRTSTSGVAEAAWRVTQRGATTAELAARVFTSGYGASVVGGSVWLLRVGDDPVAVITRADSDVVRGRARADGTIWNPHSGRWTQASILVDSLLLVGSGRAPVDDGAEAHLEYRRAEPPLGVLDEARRSSRS